MRHTALHPNTGWSSLHSFPRSALSGCSGTLDPANEGVDGRAIGNSHLRKSEQIPELWSNGFRQIAHFLSNIRCKCISFLCAGGFKVLDGLLAPMLRKFKLRLPGSASSLSCHRYLFDLTFTVFVDNCPHLSEIEIGPLIPQNMHTLCLRLADTLTDLVLHGDVLPEAFIQECMPVTLPNLKTLDLSGTNFNLRHTLKIQQEFVDIWRCARGVSFKPPSAFRDTVYRKQIAVDASQPTIHTAKWLSYGQPGVCRPIAKWS